MIVLLIVTTCAISQPKGARAAFSGAGLLSPGKDTPVENDKENISNFLRFYIPSAIVTEGIEPAAVSSLNIGFGDDKVKLKWGFSRNKDEKKFLRNSFGFSAGAKAPEGARTFFQSGKTPGDIQGGFAYTYVLNEISYSYGGNKSSEEAYWLNVNVNYNRNKVFIFSTDRDYDKKINHNFSILVGVNHYFNSWYKKNAILARNVWNISAGLGHFSNYDELDDLTLHKGVGFADMFSESESVIGKRGEFDRHFGVLLRGSAFYPISHPESKAYFMLGVNANTFGIGSSNFTANANGGIYISKRKYDEDEDLLTDIFSIGILADYSALQDWGSSGYGNKNFKLVVVSQIPLRWQ